MSKTKKNPNTFRRIKRVPSDTKKNNSSSVDTEFDIIFSRIPTHIQIPNFR
jgi:hypothetical protein